MVKKKKSETMIDLAKDSVGLGITSMAGLGAVGAIGSLPGMPAAASGITTTMGAGMTLLNVGQMGKIGMALPKMMTPESKTKSRKKSTGDSRLDKMLGK